VVNVRATPQGKDLVTYIEYNQSGKLAKNYLPVPQTGTQNGDIYQSPLTNASSFYNGEKIYSEKIFENSPLQRVQQQINVGNDWVNKPVKYNFDTNANGEVKKFETSTTWVNGATNFTINLSGSYSAGQLHKINIKDEDGNEKIIFKNLLEQTVLIRKNDGSKYLDTYYIYDNYDRLAFIIPPVAASSSLTPAILDNLCYQFHYDKKRRLVEKKLPGKGWEFILYDKQDRLVGVQDAELKKKGQWHYTKYDQFGRVTITGIATGYDRNAEQIMVDSYGSNNVNRVSTPSFERQGIDVYYGNQDTTYPNSTKWVTLLSLNYYDTYPSYSFVPAFPANILGQSILTDNSSTDGVSTKSLPVLSLIKNIEDDNWTKNYIYYDKKGRTIGNYSINHLGGFTKSETELDFAGIPKKTKVSHKRKADEAGVNINEHFEYDSQYRLLKHYHQVDDKPEELLSENTYNELSQLTNKKVGNNLQNIDYTYNIRGWVTDINKNQMQIPDLGGKLFAYKIKYNQKEGIDNPDPALFSSKNVVPKYNGNIAEIDWRSVESIGVNPSLVPKRYGYSYDGLDRLTAGYYQNPDNPYSKESTESLSYDLNGNINSLYRTSVTEYGSNTATVIDNLNYTYVGNQVTNINDASQNPTGYEGGGNTINYDLNGNMLDMLDKGINSIKYNYLNLPTSVELSKNGNEYVTINTKYGADGIKLRKENTTSIIGFNGTTTTVGVTDYLDGFQYFSSGNLTPPGGDFEMFSMRAMQPQAFTIDNPIVVQDPTIQPVSGSTFTNLKTPDLQFFPTAEGFYDYQKDKYIYQYKDQLGNARVSFTKSNTGTVEITDINDYYPLGMNHLKSGVAFFGQGNYKNYKYQEQELQETGFYSFKWRNYMPDVGRFFNIDPLSEKYAYQSHYNFSENRLIDARELEGLEMMKLYEAPSFDGLPYDGGVDSNLTWSDGLKGSSITEVTVKGQASTSEMSSASLSIAGFSLGETARFGANFIPIVGSGLDIYEGARDGDWVQFGVGIGGLALDVVTLGSGAIIKGGIKTIGTELVEEGVEMAVKDVAEEGVEAATKGAFSVADWANYPSAIPKPKGPFKILEGAEYDAARKAANKANQAIRKANPEAYKGLEIHEIQPVKYGGSATDAANKIAIPRDYHRKVVTPWWNDNMRSIKKIP
jgi:RHS repeat-associated protein